MSDGCLGWIFRFVKSCIFILFLAFCTLAVLISAGARQSETGGVGFMGYEVLLVTTSSMEKNAETDISGYEIGSIPLHSAVLVEDVPTNEGEADAFYRSLKVGDVLTFRYMYAQQMTITHRITSIKEKPTGGFLIELRGDNSTEGAESGTQRIDTSKTNSKNYVIGKVTATSHVLGLLVNALQSDRGLVLFVIIPCTAIVIAEIFNIIGGRRGYERKYILVPESVLRRFRPR